MYVFMYIHHTVCTYSRVILDRAAGTRCDRPQGILSFVQRMKVRSKGLKVLVKGGVRRTKSFPS